MLLIEGLEETFAAMNEARTKAQLPEIQLDWHNRLLSQSRLETKLAEQLTIDGRCSDEIRSIEKLRRRLEICNNGVLRLWSCGWPGVEDNGSNYPLYQGR